MTLNTIHKPIVVNWISNQTGGRKIRGRPRMPGIGRGIIIEGLAGAGLGNTSLLRTRTLGRSQPQ